MLYFVTIIMWIYRGKASLSIPVCGEPSSLSACYNCYINWPIQSPAPYRIHFQKYLSCVKTTVGSTRRAVRQSWGLSWGSLKLRAECTPGNQCSEHLTKSPSLKWIHKPFACPVCTADPARIYADTATADYTAGDLPTCRKADLSNVYI